MLSSFEERKTNGLLGFPDGSVVKNPPAEAGDEGDGGFSLDWENPPEAGMATHSSILVRKISRTQEPGGLQSMRSQRVGHS